MLNETIAVCETEGVARQLELNRKYVAYTEAEIKSLSELSESMGERDWIPYGKKIHDVKKAFPGSRVVDILKNNPPPTKPVKPLQPDSKPDSKSSKPDDPEQLPIPGLRFPDLG